MTVDSPPWIAVLASRIRWEEKEILAALDRLDVPNLVVDTRSMRVTLDGPAPPWELVLDREIGRTRARYAALALEGRGLRVVNSARAIEVCGDKWRTAIALHAAGAPRPRTALALTPEAARAAADEFGYPVVLKALMGSWGRRVALVRDADAATAVTDYCAALPHPQDRVLQLEAAIEKPGRDIRAIVVGGVVIGATYRVADRWRTNVRLGARSQPCPLSAEIAELAVLAATATGAEIAGVDLVEGPGGELYVLEVNAGVEFRGFAEATGLDVAGVIAGYAAGLVRRSTVEEVRS